MYRSGIQILLDFVHSLQHSPPVTVIKEHQVVTIKQALIACDGWKTFNVANKYMGPEPLWLVTRWVCSLLKGAVLVAMVNVWAHLADHGSGDLSMC